MKVHVRVQTIEDKIADYVENHGIEIYVDYNDKLTEEQVEMILKGERDEVISDIEDYANRNSGYDGEFDSYWEDCREATGASQEDINDWLNQGDYFYPSYYLDEYGFKQLLRNTNVKIEAVMWDVSFNLYNWAYGYPVSYSDVKDTLKLFGINPLDFKNNIRGGSAASGEGKLKGYFPNMHDRVPKINLKDLFDNMMTLYDGVVVFCLGDLENIAEVLADNKKSVTFKKDTNVVIYEFAGGAGITEVTLTEDLTIPRNKLDFRVSGKYGVQDCYEFVDSYWKDGEIE